MLPCMPFLTTAMTNECLPEAMVASEGHKPHIQTHTVTTESDFRVSAPPHLSLLKINPLLVLSGPCLCFGSPSGRRMPCPLLFTFVQATPPALVTQLCPPTIIRLRQCRAIVTRRKLKIRQISSDLLFCNSVPA